MNKIYTILLIFSLFFGCDNPRSSIKRKLSNSFENKYGIINSNEVSKIVLADKNENIEAAPVLEIIDKKDISIFINEINQANNPKPMKGGAWSRLKIFTKDAVIELRLDNNSVGLPGASGTFYFFNNPKIIWDMIEKYTIAYYDLELTQTINKIDSIRTYLSSKAKIEINACFEGTQNQATVNFREDKTFDLLWTGVLFCDLYEGTFTKSNDTLFLIYSTNSPSRIGNKFIINETELIGLGKTKDQPNLKFIKGNCLGLN